MKFVLLVFIEVLALAGPPTWNESLEGATQKALESSPALKAAKADLESAQYAKDAAFARLLPALSFEAGYFYQTNVPTITMGQGPGVSAGAHDNYSLGPVLRYTLFNGLASYNTHKSARLLVDSKAENVKSLERDLKLAVKRTYFKAQLALGNLITTQDALQVARAQSHDIDLRFAAGTSSKLDQHSARKDVTNYEIRFEQARANLTAVLQDLLVLTGQTDVYDVSAVSLALQVKFDDPSESLKQMVGLINLPAPASEQPQVKSISLVAKALEYNAKAGEGSLWPRIDLMAKGQLMYPNAIQPTQVWNNVFQVNLVVPLWLGDPNWGLASQKRREATTYRYQSEQKLCDLVRDHHKAVEAAKNLQRQMEASEGLVEQTEKIAQLTYQAYLAGRVTLLDVQTINQHLLEAQMARAETLTQLLIQLSNLEYLS